MTKLFSVGVPSGNGNKLMTTCYLECVIRSLMMMYAKPDGKPAVVGGCGSRIREIGDDEEERCKGKLDRRLLVKTTTKEENWIAGE